MARGKHKSAGRPAVITPAVLSKLKAAYLVDATDEQACLFAGISPPTLYRYQVENPELKEQKELWKGQVRLHAKMRVAKDVKKDGALALKLLERREKDNYSTRVEQEGRLEVKVMNDIEMDGVPLLYNIGERVVRDAE